MTGMESAAIAGAAAKAIGKATEEDPKENEQLRKIAESTGALDPAAKILAKRLAVKQHVRLKLWQPLGMLFGVSRDYFASDFENEMADRLQDVPDEHLVTPPMNVAAPVIQGISFTVDEPNLRAMYLNLLAAASDRRVQQTAHPSFAEIIKQLGSEEAGRLAAALGGDTLPVVQFEALDASGESWTTLMSNVVNWVDADGQHISLPEHRLYIDNWQRLGLVNIDYTSSLEDDGEYAWVASSRIFRALVQMHNNEKTTVTYRAGVIEITDYGEAFYDVVIAPPIAVKDDLAFDVDQ